MPLPVMYAPVGYVPGVSYGPSFVPQTGSGQGLVGMRGIGAYADQAFTFAKIPGTNVSVGGMDALRVGAGMIAGAFFGQRGAWAATLATALQEMLTHADKTSLLKTVAEVGVGGYAGTKLAPNVQRQLNLR